MITKQQAEKLRELIDNRCLSTMQYFKLPCYSNEMIAKASKVELDDYIKELTNDNQCQN